MLRFALLSLAVSIPLLAGSGSASIAKPTSGTNFGYSIDAIETIQLSNSNGCNFDFEVLSSVPGIVETIPAAGTGATKAKIQIRGIGVGNTMVTINSMNGTCPPASHVYSFDVSADYSSLLKDFGKFTSGAFKEYRTDTKASFTTYKNTLSDLSSQYRDSLIDDILLFQSFHDAGTDLRRDYYAAGIDAYTSVVGYGTNQLASASAEFGDVPNEFFAFGWGPFDDFQDDICNDFARFHPTYRKESHKAISSFMKAGAPGIGQLNTLPPIVSGGPLYPIQFGAITPLQPFTAPLTITSLPTTDLMTPNGRLAVSGRGDTALTGMLEVELRYELNGEMADITTLTPTISNDEWDTEFTGLNEGTYTLSVGYELDNFRIELPVQVQYAD